MLPSDNSLSRAKVPDLEKERSEKELSKEDFLIAYNTDLPETFPHVSLQQLTDFKKSYPSLFKNEQHWTLGRHRKKVMDWLPQHIQSTQVVQ